MTFPNASRLGLSGLVAGLFKVGWPLGFKLSQTTRLRWLSIAVAVLSMASSA